MMNLLTWLEATGLSVWVREAPTVLAFPTIITFHTLAMAALVGASAVLDLRLLGVGHTIPLEPLRILFRVMWAAFWVSILTGSVLFVAFATTIGTQRMFLAKLFFIVLGMTTLVMLRRRMYDATVGSVMINGSTKGLAVLSLIAWVLTITSGKLLQYAKAY